MVFADRRGRLIDHPRYEMVAHDGARVRRVREDELIPLPEGSDFFVLPGRTPLGRDPRTGRIRPMPRVNGQPATATAAFIAPAYLRLLHPAFNDEENAPALPTFAYAPLGFRGDRFWTAAVRVDPERRQDPPLFDLATIERAVTHALVEHGQNRLYRQLERCALVYGCRAAQNFYLGRWEAPLPTARRCNADCLACISLQPAGACPANHERIPFVPEPAEVAEVACAHFSRVERGIASFGQGCEGEPLLNGALLEASVRLIRERTDRGTINLNTNASRPKTVARLMAAGLDSMRVSIASARRPLFEAYHRPHDYGMDDVLASCRAVKDAGGFLMLNLLVFPGITDTEAELEALAPLLADPGIDMIQMRNLNVDPRRFHQIARSQIARSQIARGAARSAARETAGPFSRPIGLVPFMNRLRDIKPSLRFGYFNPHLERPPCG